MSEVHEADEVRGSWSVRVVLVLAFFVVIAGIAITGYDYAHTSTNSDWSNPGTRGDFWGGHSAAGFPRMFKVSFEEAVQFAITDQALVLTEADQALRGESWHKRAVDVIASARQS